jgi:hypothetical protein
MAPGERRRILVLANETLAGEGVAAEVEYRASDHDADVLVVAPKLVEGRLAHFLGGGAEAAREQAQERLDDSVDALVVAGFAARGELGDADPLQALDDAFRVFQPDEVIISTHPHARSNWLERRVVEQARSRYQVPVHHIIVDLEHETARSNPDRRPVARVSPPDERIRLYHAVDYDEALAIRESGFPDAPVEDATREQRAGVWMVDNPVGRTGDDRITFAVDVPLEVVRQFEREPGFHDERRFLVPAELLNRHGPPTVIGDDTVE